jgi:hypothetical protein
MTATLESPLITPPDEPTPPDGLTAEAPPSDGRPAALGLSCAAVAVATLAAGWMLAGVFSGLTPKIAAGVAALAGPLAVFLSYRSNRTALVQYLTLPAALLAGAIFVQPATTGGSANLPSLVVEAIRSGGLGQPPVPFEPGWRFLLVVLLVLLGAGAAALGIAGDKPRLAVSVPVPVIVGSALVQPTEHAALNTVVAIVLMVGALILSSGAQLVLEGSSSTRFETRRLVRGSGALALLAAVLIPLSQAGFLFPTPEDDTVIPPQRPQQQEPLSDRVLYTVESEKGDQGPWRLGVLDVYNGEAWLLPPYDVRRFQEITGSGDLVEATRDVTPTAADGPVGIPDRTGKTRRITVHVGDLPGRVLPVIEGAVAVTDRDLTLQFDPRTQTLRSPGGRAQAGDSYTVEAAAPPDSAALLGAGRIEPTEFPTYLQIPEPPQAVLDVLAKAPKDAFRRLQYVRTALYKKVVAAGKGEPKDISAFRVADMLNGAKASPFEITAAEAMLARWAGIPSRIGYGFYSGTRNKDNTGYEVHPRDGATWLEAYFPGSGWVTIVGRPPRAQASTNNDQRNRDNQIQATKDLALVVHVPVKLDSLTQFYETARYWLVVSLPWLALGVLLLVFYPAGLKAARRVRRARWGRAHGLPGQILVAYAELRDRLHDINATSQPAATALEFVANVEYDDEHWELAWLVTRGLYGDLRRDLRPEDAVAARQMAASVTRRALRAQRLSIRLLGAANRNSLRHPYATEIPNLWPSGARITRLRRRIRRGLSRVNPIRLVRLVVRSVRRLRPARPVHTSLLLVAVLFLGGCGDSGPPPRPPQLPAALVPTAVGEYVFQREPAAERIFAEAGSASLVTNGQVFTIRKAGEVLGSIQAAQFLPEVAGDRRKVQKALRKSLGNGDFRRRRLGNQVVDELRFGESKILLYFPPGGGYYEMLDARAGFADADRVLLAVLNHQTGSRSTLTQMQLTDPRRGADL